MSLYRFVTLEEAKKIAREVYEAYTVEVHKKWEQFKEEFKDVPEEILYDQDSWDDAMMDRWIDLIDEIDTDAIKAKYPGVFIWIEHEEDIWVEVVSASFSVRTWDGKEFEIDTEGFRSWKHVELENLNRERFWSIRRAWDGFARLFFPWALEENRWLYTWSIDSWLELEVYRVAREKGAWKEGNYLDYIGLQEAGA